MRDRIAKNKELIKQKMQKLEGIDKDSIMQQFAANEERVYGAIDSEKREQLYKMNLKLMQRKKQVRRQQAMKEEAEKQAEAEASKNL